MGQKCDQLVIGRGASGLSFLFYSREAQSKEFAAQSTIVIGRNDLWGNVSAYDKDHRFGQPQQIVSAPGRTQPTVDDPQFQTAKQVNDQLREMERSLSKQGGITFLNGEVQRITRAKTGGFEVEFTQYTPTGTLSGRKCDAKQVIVATGFGPSSRPSQTVLPATLTQGSWSHCVMGGTEYLYSPVKKPSTKEFVVAVQGSSATSSWAVMRAIALGASKIYWISRDNFKNADPAGRNSDLLMKASDNGWLTIAQVKSVKPNGNRLLMTLAKPDDKQVPGKTLSHLGEAYKKYYEENQKSKAAKRHQGLDLKVVKITNDKEFDIDHFVYALGADAKLPGGAGDLLGPLANELYPVFDTEKRFGDVEAETTVAFRTQDKDLWVVGAAVFRYLGLAKLKDHGDNFKNISAMMCEAGTPPEGIAAVFASMKAVTGYYETKQLNIQTADFKEIEKWLEKLYQERTGKAISENTKRVMTDQIVALRKHTVFGLSKAEVDGLTNPSTEEFKGFWNAMLTLDDTNGVTELDRLVVASLTKPT